jgi:plasmid stability protein
MATVYVENVAEEVYAAIRERAKRNRRSIAAEISEVLAREFPGARELSRRRAAFRRALELQAEAPAAAGPFPTAEEMVRELRAR